MSQVIKTFPGVPGRPPVYPWDEWSDGRVWRLTRGEDFNSDPKSFRVLVHRTAKSRGLKARTHIESQDVFVLAFYDPADE